MASSLVLWLLGLALLYYPLPPQPRPVPVCCPEKAQGPLLSAAAGEGRDQLPCPREPGASFPDYLQW